MRLIEQLNYQFNIRDNLNNKILAEVWIKIKFCFCFCKFFVKTFNYTHRSPHNPHLHWNSKWMNSFKRKVLSYKFTFPQFHQPASCDMLDGKFHSSVLSCKINFCGCLIIGLQTPKSLICPNLLVNLGGEGKIENFNLFFFFLFSCH